MESGIVLSEIQNNFRSGLSGYYTHNEIRQIFELISEHLLNYSKIDIFLKSGEPISQEVAEKFDTILTRLKNWEPVQYILGHTWFYGQYFYVNRQVLIPRQETEELADWVIKNEAGYNCDLLDIGTGSGCLAVTFAINMPQARVSACDISVEALGVAKNNALHNKARVSFFEFDVLNDQLLLPGQYHVMISNPPYVRNQEKTQMRANVLNYEPDIALYVPDNDPLLFYKRIALLGRKYLLDGGILYFEINENFSEEMAKLLKSVGFFSVEIKSDLNGKPRMIRARK